MISKKSSAKSKSTYGYSQDNGKTWISKPDSKSQFKIGRKPNRGKWYVISSLVAPYGSDIPPPPDPTDIPSIGTLAVVNASSHSDDEVKKWVLACEKQADNEIAKYWGYSLNVEFVPKGEVIPNVDIYCGILNDTEEAGALGWHDYANGVPSIKIFAKECDKYNVPVSTCISHEFAEMIGDLNCNTTVKGLDENGKSCLYFRENCDPTEDDSFSYQIDNVPVSDFVLPTWFQKISKGPYDFKNKCVHPFEILYGGYMLISYDNGATWDQVDKFDKANEQHSFWKASHTGKGSRWDIYQKVLRNEPLDVCDIEFGKDIAGGHLFEQGKL